MRPIASCEVSSNFVKLCTLVSSATSPSIYFTEASPTNGGRSVITAVSPSHTTETISSPHENVRSVVHEYGGGSFSPFSSDYTIATLFPSNSVVIYEGSGSIPHTLIPPGKQFRYANFCVATTTNNTASSEFTCYCIEEDHSPSGSAPASSVINTIVSLTFSSSAPFTLLGKSTVAEGADFYSGLTLSSPTSPKFLSFVQWFHPNMPWDSTEVYELNLATSSVTKVSPVNCSNTSPLYDRFDPASSKLYFLSDVDDVHGCYDLYVYDREGKTTERIVAIQEELIAPGDGWVIGLSSYGFAKKGMVVSLCNKMMGGCSLVVCEGGNVEKIEFDRIDSISELVTSSDSSSVYFFGGSYISPPSLWSYNLDTKLLVEVHKSVKEELDMEALVCDFVKPDHIMFDSEEGEKVHGYFYKAGGGGCGCDGGGGGGCGGANPPPLLVKAHGGPTSSTSITFRLDIQYWTTRGFAVLDVDYRGSSGYGKAYRSGLKNKNWGLVDTDDVCNGAKYLADKGLVDPAKMAIDGGSAGGYTTLCALVFRDVFTVGASKYGISDLASLCVDTHKFESHYIDFLMGVLPDDKELFESRCPILHLDKLKCPVILLQGKDDKVVPPNQAVGMYDALREKGIDSVLVMYDGEQHGFRKAENITHALDAEYLFFCMKFGIEPVEFGGVEITMNTRIDM